MSDFVSASAIKNFLAECPICLEQFDEDNRIPRRMPCCVQSVCQPCLETYSRGRQTLNCPMCRHQHHLPCGVNSLPKEPLILKILDHLKIQKGLHLPCTDCPDGNHAVARCDDCAIFLCQECLNAHRRARTLRDHKIVTFEEMKGRPVESFRRLHQCNEHKQPVQFFCHTCNKVICVSCTVVDHKEGKGHSVVKIDDAHLEKASSIDELLKKLEVNIEKTSNTLAGHKKKLDNIKVSKKAAKAEVDKAFDELTEKIQQRRAVVLSEVDARYDDNVKLTEKAVDSTTSSLTKMKSSVQYMKEMRSKADKIEDLQLMVSSANSLTAMLEESPQDTEIARTGISFVPFKIKQLKSDIQASGLVRTVQFKPTPIPKSHLHLNFKFFDTITLEPANIPEVVSWTTPTSDTGLSFPQLEWDTSTSSDDISITGSVISNTRPDPPLPDTGCRFQAARRVISSTPLVITRGQRIMYQFKTNFSIKEISLYQNVSIFEAALCGTAVDGDCSQFTDLSLRVITCTKHKGKLCLTMVYNDREFTNDPITGTNFGATANLHIGILVDSVGKIHVIDVAAVRVIATITGVVFDKQLWVTMFVEQFQFADMQGELVTGKNVTLSTAMNSLIKSL